MSRLACVILALAIAFNSSACAGNEIPRQGLVAPAEQAVLDALDQPVEIHLRETPLAHLVGFCRARRIPTMLDFKALNDVGVSSDVPVTLEISGVSLRTALEALLRPMDLAWSTRDGVLWITTPEESNNHLSLRTYDVRDIAPFALVDGEREYDTDMIIEMITSTVHPNMWDEVGGPGSIQVYQHGDVLALAIDQSPEVHRTIDLLLWQLRQYRNRSWNLAAVTRPSSHVLSSPALSMLTPVNPPARPSRRYIEAPTWAEKAAQQHQPPRFDQPRAPDGGKGFF